jgi:hypothetical protein
MDAIKGFVKIKVLWPSKYRTAKHPTDRQTWRASSGHVAVQLLDLLVPGKLPAELLVSCSDFRDLVKGFPKVPGKRHCRESQKSLGVGVGRLGTRFLPWHSSASFLAAGPGTFPQDLCLGFQEGVASLSTRVYFFCPQEAIRVTHSWLLRSPCLLGETQPTGQLRPGVGASSLPTHWEDKGQAETEGQN